MKKNKSTTLRILLFACLLSASACNNSGSTSTGNMADTVVSKVDSAAENIKRDAQNAANDVKSTFATNPDSNFVVKATIANMEELKAHGKMMIADHKKLGEKVKKYASDKGYILPADDNGKGDDAICSLDKNNKGIDWDKAWTNKMVGGHEDAVNLFENNQNTVKDPDLKALITDALPTLHTHLDMMKKLQSKLGK